jgi:radical SAM superfamily enzyme with C-terminal helix-hairpin-helix motif
MYEQLYIATYRSCKGYSGNCSDCIVHMRISYLGQDNSVYDVSPYVAIFKK